MFLVDGQWNKWSVWSYCNATCGGGISFRTRNCSFPTNGGKDCTGDIMTLKPCAFDSCSGNQILQSGSCMSST